VTESAIIHVDMDAFFVSCELLRHPELRGQPVVVGGAGNRGVVAAASYEARAFGVHSALSSAIARRRCPQAVFIAGDHRYYSGLSRQIMAIFKEFTPLVEPLSLDEAFLDVTGSRRLFGPATSIAEQLRTRVLDDSGLTCSVGVAPNKFLAKLASEAAKPVASPDGPLPGPGVVVVRPGRELEFLHPLDVSALWGVGPVTLDRLRKLGIGTVGELSRIPLDALVGAVGKSHGAHLYALAAGTDDRAVIPNIAAQSVSHEVTFPVDLTNNDDLHREIVRLVDAVTTRLRQRDIRARTLSIKVRFPDRQTISRSRTLDHPSDRSRDLVEVATDLLAEVPTHRGVRLLGVAASNLTDGSTPLSLDLGDGASDEGWDAAYGAVDAIRNRFGSAVIGPATLAGNSESLGNSPWGPESDETTRGTRR